MSAELTAADRERFQVLLTKAVDGELDAAEQEEFDHFLSDYPQCRREWQEHKELKEVTKKMRFKAPPDTVWDNYWVNVYNRLERRLAWILFSIGAMILLTYGGFKAIENLIADSHLTGVVKLGLVLVIGGGAILLVSVFREKIVMTRHDPYKEVRR